MFKEIAVIILVVSAFTACTSPTVSSGNAQSEGAKARTASTPKQDSVNAATPPARPDEADGAEPSFQGTAGITEKKNPNLTESVVAAYVRSARHEGFDRVVFEFLGDQLPAYKIEYVDTPVRACGSGNVVPFAGDAWLSVRFTGAQAHAPAGDATIPVKDRARSPNLPVVKDLKMICDFEGEVEWVMGAPSPNRYRVLELKNPSRLAVDIKH
jgi:hypothetical protein